MVAQLHRHYFCLCVNENNQGPISPVTDIKLVVNAVFQIQFNSISNSLSIRCYYLRPVKSKFAFYLPDKDVNNEIYQQVVKPVLNVVFENLKSHLNIVHLSLTFNNHITLNIETIILFILTNTRQSQVARAVVDY